MITVSVVVSRAGTSADDASAEAAAHLTRSLKSRSCVAWVEGRQVAVRLDVGRGGSDANERAAAARLIESALDEIGLQAHVP